ncbi:uncharacterized protein [Typha latifolia]|uniref:uncharacterized protein n=1 Tax=Typha latifolia TaxID=4733 RepID=UPI003C30AE2A
MEVAVKTNFVTPQLTGQNCRLQFRARVIFSRRVWSSVHIVNASEQNSRRSSHNIGAIQTESSIQNLENPDASIPCFNDFTVAANVVEDKEIKIRVDVSGAKTQAIFDDAFSKLVAAAQPIPGFRRVKGGKTPDIPKDVLLHIIGPSKVYKQSIKRIINYTVAEYVEKQSVKVGKNLKVEQNYEELEAAFQPGKDFSFDAILQLQGNDMTIH